MELRHRDHKSESGQVLILFAFFLTAMVGVLALSVDLGVSFSERRAMQNAADASALAGARVVSKSTAATSLSAQGPVADVAGKNAMQIGAIDGVNCVYVDDHDASLGSCSGVVPRGATGVTVTVSETHPTFFIRAMPGGPTTAHTSATATAHVLMPGAPKDGPFLPCATKTVLASGGTIDLLQQSNGVWAVNPNAVGKTFVIHGPQVEPCNTQSGRFKGMADMGANKNATAPGWFSYTTGDIAGQVSSNVDGPNGCKANQPVLNCVVILPIVAPNPGETNNSKQVWVVTFAAFYVTAPDANTHVGTLLGDYIEYGAGKNGSSGWWQGYSGPIVIRLTS